MAKRENLIEYISHTAIVTGIDPQKGIVRVSISDAGECGGCPAAGICSATSSKDAIEISTPQAATFIKGETVEIRGTEQMHRKAIMLATVLPCIILIVIMSLIFIFTGSQAAAALGGLLGMIFFFIILYLCRNHIAHEFQFRIFKIS